MAISVPLMWYLLVLVILSLVVALWLYWLVRDSRLETWFLKKLGATSFPESLRHRLVFWPCLALSLTFVFGGGGGSWVWGISLFPLFLVEWAFGRADQYLLGRGGHRGH